MTEIHDDDPIIVRHRLQPMGNGNELFISNASNVDVL
jgi:hypothetical protein